MSSSGANKFFDVSHPNKTQADASSRPVIVGNRPLMEDPMMVKQPAVATHKTTDIKPLHSQVVADETPIELPSKTIQSSNIPESEQHIEQLTEEQAYFVPIKGSKGKKVLSHAFLLIGSLAMMAAVGYYAVTFIRK